MQSKVDASKLELTEEIVDIRRVAKTVKGGRNMRFSVTVVVGDGEGHVGMGLGKAIEIPEAVRKATEDAKKKLQDIEEIKKTIAGSADAVAEWQTQLAESIEKKNAMSEKHRGFFQKQEDISQRRNNLDKEIMRLGNILDIYPSFRQKRAYLCNNPFTVFTRYGYYCSHTVSPSFSSVISSWSSGR